MGSWKMCLVSKWAIFHFHDYGRKGKWDVFTISTWLTRWCRWFFVVFWCSLVPPMMPSSKTPARWNTPLTFRTFSAVWFGRLLAAHEFQIWMVMMPLKRNHPTSNIRNGPRDTIAAFTKLHMYLYIYIYVCVYVSTCTLTYLTLSVVKLLLVSTRCTC